MSLLFSTFGEERQIEECNVLRDFPVNNFIGSRSLEYNLSLIPVKFDLKIAELLERDKEYILNGLNEILTQNHLTKIWEMIWKRWCRYEEIRSEGSALWK